MRSWASGLVCLALCALGVAQDTLQSMPRYDRYSRLSREIGGSVVNGGVFSNWSDDSKAFTYSFEGKIYKYDLATKRASETEEAFPSRAPEGARRRRPRGGGGQPDRGRQFTSATSPDGKLVAVSRGRNVYIGDMPIRADASSSSDGAGRGPSVSSAPLKNEFAVTTDGNLEARTKYGAACWVYGEELGVREAMWWSPNSQKLAYYRFDEKDTKDYYVTLSEGNIQNILDTEAYPKAGAPNPKVELYVFDVATKKTTKVETSFGDASLAEYIYDVRWSTDGKELFFNRTNRKQNWMQFCTADPDAGTCRVVVEEKQPQSWAENHPEISFLKDNDRFIWASERNGYKNYYLYDLSGKLLKTLTANKVDAISILRVEEDKNLLFYTSCGADNPYFRQLHRVRLDGTKDTTLTTPDLDHEVSLAPDGKHFTDIAQAPDRPAETRLVDDRGAVLDTFVKSDTTKFDAMGLKRTEVFTYLAADGKTTLYGTLQFPSDFDPARRYPVVVSVYGGPESGGINQRFATPNPITELGFIVANFAGRGTTGRGKAFRDAVYEKLGVVEIDDQAAGATAIGKRPYIDPKRIGIFGTSYGGYSTVMSLLRHPEAFAVGCASSSVTDWRNYDSIYTERYMGLPDEADNKTGYDAGSAMRYASNLRGKLMLYFGSADNNVHPANTYQLVQALENAGKRYDMQVGTDKGHTQMNSTRMWEYFVTHLIVSPSQDALQTVWNSRKYRKAKTRALARASSPA